MTLIRALAVALLLAAIAVSSSCGGTKGGLPLEDLEEEFIAAFCGARVACGSYPDVATCEDSVLTGLEQMLTDLEAGLIEYDGVKARECIGSLYDASCSVFGSATTGPNEACAGTFTGTIALGEACFDSASCAGQAYCDGSQRSMCTPGICVAQVPDAAEGESCAEADCAGDLGCNEAAICEALPGPGASCEMLFDCAYGSICVSSEDFQTSSCVEVPSTGETCDPEIGLGGQFSCFSSTDFCDPVDTTCKAKRQPGAACSSPHECVDFSECIGNTCQALLRAGESCEVDGELRCLGSLQCEAGTCVKPPELQACAL